jgi:peptide/nickel transport system permease protein
LFWWPGVFIITIALCINFIGDGLRDAFDPRQKRMPNARALARGADLDGAAAFVTSRGGSAQAGTGRGSDANRPDRDDKRGS